jgi:hypothetical protein
MERTKNKRDLMCIGLTAKSWITNVKTNKKYFTLNKMFQSIVYEALLNEQKYGMELVLLKVEQVNLTSKSTEKCMD